MNGCKKNEFTQFPYSNILIIINNLLSISFSPLLLLFDFPFTLNVVTSIVKSLK